MLYIYVLKILKFNKVYHLMKAYPVEFTSQWLIIISQCGHIFLFALLMKLQSQLNLIHTEAPGGSGKEKQWAIPCSWEKDAPISWPHLLFRKFCCLPGAQLWDIVESLLRLVWPSDYDPPWSFICSTLPQHLTGVYVEKLQQVIFLDGGWIQIWATCCSFEHLAISRDSF